MNPLDQSVEKIVKVGFSFCFDTSWRLFRQDVFFCRLHCTKIELDGLRRIFAGLRVAAQKFAMFYSFFGTCKAHGVNPRLWLEVVNEVVNETKKGFEVNPSILLWLIVSYSAFSKPSFS